MSMFICIILGLSVVSASVVYAACVVGGRFDAEGEQP